jgi:pimeloyl-ACP methyl ester carboxylesterase
MLRTALSALAGVLLLYAAACLLLYLFQRSLLYFPQPARVLVPALTLSVPGAELQVSVRAHAGPRAVLYFGGNAEDVSSSLAELAATFPEHAVYSMHYRGYGRSTGKPTETALHADAIALFNHVAREHTEITVIGRSLGSGVAIRLAAGRPVSRLVLVAPYDSVAAVAAQQFALFPVRWLIRDRFDSASVAPTIRAPTTVIVAERDEVIRRQHSDALVARFAPGVAQVIVIPGAGHNTLDGRPSYEAALAGQP